jgi:hypothetical protein
MHPIYRLDDGTKLPDALDILMATCQDEDIRDIGQAVVSGGYEPLSF